MYRKILFALVIGVFTNSIFAQNTKDCSKMGIETIDFSNPNLTVNGNLLVIPQNGTKGEGNWLIFTRCTKPNVTEIVIDLRGEDIKGNKTTVSATGKLNAATGLFEAQVSGKATEMSPFYIREISCTTTNACNEKASFTKLFGNTGTKTNFAVLLNGRVGLNNGVCHFGRCFCLDDRMGEDNMLILGDLLIDQSIKASKEGFTHTFSIGLANGPIEDNDIIESLLMWNKLQMIAVTTVRDENGKLYRHRERAKFHGGRMAHMIQDSYPRGHNSRIVSIDLEFVNDAMDTFRLNTYGGEGYKPGSGEYFAWTEKWSINQGVGKCEIPDLKKVFVKELIVKNTVSVVLGLNNSKEDKAVPLASVLDGVDVQSVSNMIWIQGNNQKIIRMVKPERDSLGNWVFKDNFTFTGNDAPVLASVELNFISVCGESFGFVGDNTNELKNKDEYSIQMDNKEKVKKDPCNTKYRLKELNYSETNLAGMYALNVQFQFENNSDVPEEVAMIVELTDCNGKRQYIRMALKYNALTGIYSGSQALVQDKACPWAMTYGEIAAYNACKDKTVWSFETSQSKSNGYGTRSVATTTNGKPGLL